MSSATASSAKNKQLIVGAGICGLECAIAFAELGYAKDQWVIYESSSAIGGCWKNNSVDDGSCCYGGAVNTFTTIQTDPVIYSPPGWFLDPDHSFEVTDPFLGIHTTQSKAMSMFQELAEKFDIESNIQYNRKLISFDYGENNAVNVTWEDTTTGEVHQETFAGVHFRTGRLSKLKNIPLRNEANFTGPVILGGYNEATKLSWEGKTVAVIGWGSFATENIGYFLRNGAKRVHVISRSEKPHWFDYVTYLSHCFYSTERGTDPEYCSRVWDKMIDAQVQASTCCGIKDLIANESLYPTIEGKRHCYFAQGGCPAFSIDPVALGIHYGMIEYHRGSVMDLQSSAVIMKSGEIIEDIDIIVKCTGFETVFPFLENHYMTDTIFVDGKPNVTSLHSIDGIEESTYFGPCMPTTSGWLLSAFVCRDFNKAIAYFMANPDDKFQEFKNSPLFGTRKRVLDVGLVNTNVLFTKMFAFGDMNIIKNFAQSMTLKQEEYAKVLDEQTFLQYDKERWDTWSEFLAKRAGKPALAYPFIDRMTTTKA